MESQSHAPLVRAVPRGIASFDDDNLPSARLHGLLSLMKPQFGTHLTEALRFPAVLRTSNYLNATSGTITDEQFVRFAALFDLCHLKAPITLENMNRKIYAPFMAFAEVIVPTDIHFPDEPNEQESRDKICRMIRGALVNNEGKLALGYENFYKPAPENEVDARPATERALDEHVQWISQDPEANISWANDLHLILDRYVAMHKAKIIEGYMQAVVEFIFVMSVRGSCTPQKINKYREAVSKENKVKFNLEPTDVERIWRYAERVIHDNGVDVEKMMRTLASMFPAEKCIRIHQTIQQAEYSGAATTTIIIDAMASYMNHPVWSMLLQACKAEFNIIAEHARTLATNKFSGYGKHNETEKIKGTNVPNIFYAAVMLKKTMQGDQTVTGYARRVNPSMKVQIDAIIEKYKTETAAKIKPDDYEFPHSGSLADVIQDMAFLKASFDG